VDALHGAARARAWCDRTGDRREHGVEEATLDKRRIAAGNQA
jgi:hypothetical protein